MCSFKARGTDQGLKTFSCTPGTTQSLAVNGVLVPRVLLKTSLEPQQLSFGRHFSNLSPVQSHHCKPIMTHSTYGPDPEKRSFKFLRYCWLYLISTDKVLFTGICSSELVLRTMPVDYSTIEVIMRRKPTADSKARERAAPVSISIVRGFQLICSSTL